MPDQTGHTACVVAPPKSLPAHPNARRVKPKTGNGAGKRRRWQAEDGTIYEWDSQHGTVEVYDKRGHHQGEIDPNTGATTKEAIPGRRVEP